MTSWQQQIDNAHFVKPSAISGKANGSDALKAVLHPLYDHLGHAVGFAAPVAARSYNAMVKAAWKEGVALTPSGPEDSFRPLGTQQRIFKQRYTTHNTGVKGRSCGGVYYYKVNSHVATAACPGDSNHGLGCAVDFDLSQRGALAWLEAHAKAYGWQWETQEAWHLHYMLGDQISQAVLNSEPSAPTTLPEEDDMEIIELTKEIAKEREHGDGKDGQLWLRQGSTYKHITDANVYFEMCKEMPGKGFDKPTVISNGVVWVFLKG